MEGHYRFKVVRVVDGDTVDVNVDLGFHVWFLARIRLMGYNAPEKGSGPHYVEMMEEGWGIYGVLAKRALERALVSGLNDTLITYKADKFGGRWLGDFAPKENGALLLTRDLITRGYGVAWNGRGMKPEPWEAPGATYPGVYEGDTEDGS